MIGIVTVMPWFPLPELLIAGSVHPAIRASEAAAVIDPDMQLPAPSWAVRPCLASFGESCHAKWVLVQNLSFMCDLKFPYMHLPVWLAFIMGQRYGFFLNLGDAYLFFLIKCMVKRCEGWKNKKRKNTEWHFFYISWWVICLNSVFKYKCHCEVEYFCFEVLPAPRKGWESHVYHRWESYPFRGLLLPIGGGRGSVGLWKCVDENVR